MASLLASVLMGVVEDLSPKKLGPDHLVPVISRAITERLLKVLPRYMKPFSRTTASCISPRHSRSTRVPGLRIVAAAAPGERLTSLGLSAKNLRRSFAGK